MSARTSHLQRDPLPTDSAHRERDKSKNRDKHSSSTSKHRKYKDEAAPAREPALNQAPQSSVLEPLIKVLLSQFTACVQMLPDLQFADRISTGMGAPEQPEEKDDQEASR